MTQSSTSKAPNSDTDMDRDMGTDPGPQLLLIDQTRDLTLVPPGVPAPSMGVAASEPPSLSSPASPASSKTPSSPSPPSRHDASGGNATSLGGDEPHTVTDAQPFPLACPYTCATFGAEDESHGTSCQSQPGTVSMGAARPGPVEGEAVEISSQGHGRGQGRNTQAIADQPVITFAAISCYPYANAAPPASWKNAPAATSTPEWETAAAKDGVVMRSSAAGTPVNVTRLSWDDGLDFDGLPNEVLMHILSFLEVCDLLATSRTNHHLRTLSLQPILHRHRLRRARLSLPSLLVSPSRPTLRDLISRRIFLTHTTQVSRRLARNLVAIRLSRRLPLRPSAEVLVQRGVLPGECVEGSVAPGLVAKKRAVERERLKDGLRRWVGGVWRGEVRQRAEGVRQWEESCGVGRVWRLRRFWERVSRGGDNVR